MWVKPKDMKNRKIKNKILSALFLGAFTTNLFAGMLINKPVPVYANSLLTQYSALTSITPSVNGPTIPDVVRANYNKSSVFPSTLTYKDNTYFGVLSYSSSAWVGSQWGAIGSKTATASRSATQTAGANLVRNGDFQLREDGGTGDSTMPLHWSIHNGGVWRPNQTSYRGYIALIPYDGNTAYLDSSNFSASAGSSYTLELDWWQESGGKGANVQVLFFNSSGSHFANSFVGARNSTSQERVIHPFTAPAGTTAIRIRLLSSGRVTTTNNAAFFANISVVSGNLNTTYGNLFTSTVNVVDGDYSGDIGKSGTPIWSSRTGETGRTTPVITNSETRYVSGNFFNAASNFAASKTVTFYDSYHGTNVNVTLNRASASFTGNRTFAQINGTHGTSSVYNSTNSWLRVSGYANDFTDDRLNYVISNGGVTGLSQSNIGGISPTPQFAWYGGSSTSYRTAMTGWNTYYYADPPRLNNDTGYIGYGTPYDGLRNVIFEMSGSTPSTVYRVLNNSSRKGLNSAGGQATYSTNHRYPFYPIGGGRDTADPLTLSYITSDISLMDYGFVMTYNGWWNAVHTNTSYTSYSWNESGSHRRFVSAAYTKTHSKEATATYSGSASLNPIPAGTTSITQYYSGTIYSYGHTHYNATPTYSSPVYQRIKGAINKPATQTYQKYEKMTVYDMQTYDENITSMRIELVNQTGNNLGFTRNVTTTYSSSGYHKRWTGQEIVIPDTIADTPSGQTYYVRITSLNGATEVKILDIPFKVSTPFEIEQPTLNSDSGNLYAGKIYTLNVAGPKVTNSITVRFPFSIMRSGVRVNANTDIVIGLTENAATGRKSGSLVFSLDETQAPSSSAHTITVTGRSITDNYVSTKTITNVYIRLIRIMGLTFISKKMGPRVTDEIIVNQSAPVASPIEVKTGYNNNLRVEHRRADVMEIEFFTIGNQPVNNIEFSSTSGQLVRYTGTMTNSTKAVTNGDNQNDNKVTIKISDPTNPNVDVKFVLPQVFRDSNIGQILEVKITVYDALGAIVNDTLGRSFVKIIGSEQSDRANEKVNNVR